MSSTRTERPRILTLIKGLGIGGAERLISDGSAHWDLTGFEYRVAYVLPWKDQLVGDLRHRGIEVTCIGGRRGLDLMTPKRLRTLIRDWGPDLIHAHLPAAGILARVSTEIPTVYTEHNLADSYRQPTRALNRLTYWRNRAVIAVSEAVAGSVAGYPGPQPVIVPNGVSLEPPQKAESIRGELGIGGSVPLVVHVGNIRPHKGHSNLIAATQILANHVPDVVVVSIGAEKQSGDLARLRHDAVGAGVSERIRFMGRRADAAAFLAAADAVVNPSDVEGLPVALLEALAFARPVVATEVGGVSSVVKHEMTGLLVPSRDPRALSEALIRALTSPEAKEWGREGAALVARDHGLEKMIGDCEQIYREVLSA